MKKKQEQDNMLIEHINLLSFLLDKMETILIQTRFCTNTFFVILGKFSLTILVSSIIAQDSLFVCLFILWYFNKSIQCYNNIDNPIYIS